MDPERWRRVEELYHSALEHDPEQRHAFLIAVCGADEDILHEVETLLQVDAHGDFVIDKPAFSARDLEDSQVLGTEALPSLSPGTEVGPYVIESQIGAGGMGEVYRARDTRLRRKVALKFLREDVADDVGRRRRFESEARAVAALNHPNIVSIFDFGQLNGYPYAVSELIEGQSLRGLLRKGAVPVRKLIDFAVQIADGLAAAHAAGIAHRDLKPENIMVSNEGRIKILDFGLAQRVPHRMETSPDGSGTGVNLTEPGAVVGTPSYMSPEQARGAVADYRSDQFSFGLVLYELATGKQAFARASTVETLTAIVREEPAPIERKLPAPLRWTIDRCLAKDPRERYESTRDLFEDLRSLRDHLSDAYSSSELLGGQPHKLRLSRVWKAIALAATTTAIFIIAVLLLLGRKNAGADLAGYRYTPLAIDAKMHSDAQWSPDGKAIAYSAWVPGQWHVFVRYLASPVATDLGIGRDNAAPQRWSADSKRLVVFAASPNSTPRNTKFALYTASAIGGGAPAFITDLPQESAASDTSSDLRTSAVFCRCEGSRFTVFFSSPAGSPWRHYQPDPFTATTIYNDAGLKFAPDGKKIVLLYTDERSEPEAWVLPFPPSAGNPHRVLQDLPKQTVLGNSSWMPDSRHFVLSITVAGQQHLWFADTSSNERYQLTTGTPSEDEPAVSPDGRTLAFTQSDFDLNVVSLSLIDYTTRTLVGTERRERMAAWAAKAEQLAYVTDRNGPMEVWIRPADGSNRPAVTQGNFPNSRTQSIMNPSLSPDGTRLIFVRQGSDGATRNWIMSLSDGVPHRLNDSATDTEFGGTWSPDGHALLTSR